MTPRDLTTHRSGLPRHDIVWYNTHYPRSELLQRLPYLASNKPFRSTWQYNNLMFLVAGLVAERITGQTWEQAVRERIFTPLGMKTANFSVEDSQKAPDFALPYAEVDDVVKRIPFRNIDNVGPAGSINACIDELAPWLMVHLNGGKLGDKQVIRGSTLTELHTTQMAMGAPQSEPEIVPGGYALGWMTDAYRGHARVHHGGAIDGFIAEIVLFPQDATGIAVLCNHGGSALPGLVALHAADRVLGLEPIDWNAKALVKKAQGKSVQKEAKEKKESVRKTGTQPAHPLSDYAGEYEHPGYRTATVVVRDGKLELTFNDISVPLTHWHYEVFNAGKGGADGKDETLEDTKVLFVTGFSGDIEGLRATLEPAIGDVVFKRKADAKLSDPAYLQQLVGAYDLAGQTMTVSLRATTLVVEVPGQPPYDQRPVSNDTFEFVDLPGFRIHFTRSDAGEVTGLECIQPNGVFTAKRKT